MILPAYQMARRQPGRHCIAGHQIFFRILPCKKPRIFRGIVSAQIPVHISPIQAVKNLYPVKDPVSIVQRQIKSRTAYQRTQIRHRLFRRICCIFLFQAICQPGFQKQRTDLHGVAGKEHLSPFLLQQQAERLHPLHPPTLRQYRRPAPSRPQRRFPISPGAAALRIRDLHAHADQLAAIGYLVAELQRHAVQIRKKLHLNLRDRNIIYIHSSPLPCFAYWESEKLFCNSSLQIYCFHRNRKSLFCQPSL